LGRGIQERNTSSERSRSKDSSELNGSSFGRSSTELRSNNQEGVNLPASTSPSPPLPPPPPQRQSSVLLPQMDHDSSKGKLESAPKFDGNDYWTWSFRFEQWAEAHDLWGYFDGSEERLASSDARLKWERRNQKAFAQFCNALLPDELIHLVREFGGKTELGNASVDGGARAVTRVPAGTAAAYTRVKEFYLQRGLCNWMALSEELSSLKMKEGEGVAAYWARAEDLRSKYLAAGGKEEVEEWMMRVIKGLPPHFEMLKVVLNNQSPSLTKDQLLTYLRSEEMRIGVAPRSDGVATFGAGTKVGSSGRGNGDKDGKLGGSGSSSDTNSAFLKRGGRGSNGKAQVADEEEQDDKAEAVVGEAVAAVGEEQPREGWWIDSGVSHNFTPYALDFKSKLQPPEVRGVRLGDGRVVKAVGMGEVPVVGAGGQLLRIQKVHLVPEMHTRLLSVPHLTSRDVQMDFWGPVRTPSLGGAVYVLSLIDDFTIRVWSFPLPNKESATVAKVLRQWHKDVELECGRKLKAVRSDRGGEFLGDAVKAWKAEFGIKTLLSVADIPQQNGVVERWDRTMAEGIRTLLVDSGLPARLWGEALISRMWAWLGFGVAWGVSCYMGMRRVASLMHGLSPVTGLQVLGIQSGTGGEEVGGDAGVVEGMLCLAREVEGVALAGMSTGDVPRTLAEALRGPEGPALMYAAVTTRPDMSFTVNTLAQSCVAPRCIHMRAALRALRYLVDTADRVIRYERQGGEQVVGYTDSDWGGETDGKSRSAYIFKLGGGAISWYSKKQDSVAASVSEAEYKALSEGAKEAIWLRSLLAEMHVGDGGAIPLLCDNEAAVSFAHNPVLHQRTKHIKVAWHFVRDAVRQQEVKVHSVRTHLHDADMLTKALPSLQLHENLERIGMRVMAAKARASFAGGVKQMHIRLIPFSFAFFPFPASPFPLPPSPIPFPSSPFPLPPSPTPFPSSPFPLPPSPIPFPSSPFPLPPSPIPFPSSPFPLPPSPIPFPASLAPFPAPPFPFPASPFPFPESPFPFPASPFPFPHLPSHSAVTSHPVLPAPPMQPTVCLPFLLFALPFTHASAK
ncbi:unnamed protein product, partial [Closterium sp. NIES-54]